MIRCGEWHSRRTQVWPWIHFLLVYYECEDSKYLAKKTYSVEWLFCLRMVFVYGANCVLSLQKIEVENFVESWEKISKFVLSNLESLENIGKPTYKIFVYGQLVRDSVKVIWQNVNACLYLAKKVLFGKMVRKIIKVTSEWFKNVVAY